VLGLRKGPLLAAVALPVLFAVFGTALVGGSGLEWYEGLEKPGFLVPLGIFYLVGALYYALFAVVVYRVLARVDDPRGRTLSLGLTVGSCSSTSCGTMGSSACAAHWRGFWASWCSWRC
jgi:TspO/MBR family